MHVFTFIAAVFLAACAWLVIFLQIRARRRRRMFRAMYPGIHVIPTGRRRR